MGIPDLASQKQNCLEIFVKRTILEILNTL